MYLLGGKRANNEQLLNYALPRGVQFSPQSEGGPYFIAIAIDIS
jgi:hypothetical protein